MASQRREENSLFLSLREVQNLVEDRVREEEEEKQRAADAVVQAREDAIRRVKDEEDRKVREVEDRERMERERLEKQRREEQLRLEESERRARIEAQARLEEARIKAEADAIANRPFPWRTVAVVTAVLLAVSGGVISLVVQYQKQAKAEEIARVQQRLDIQRRQDEDERKKLEAAAAEMATKLSSLEGKYKAARTAEEQRRIAAEMKDASARASAARSAAAAADKKSKEKAKKATLDKCLKDPNDPLCGL
jgi:colicin import membrane protein